MDDKKGIPQYRCQRCGDVKMNTNAPLVQVQILHLFAHNPFAVECGGVPAKAVHDCDDGGAGIASIVGFFPEQHLPALLAELKKQEEAEAKRRSQLVSSAN
jgi:hypothetical protein